MSFKNLNYETRKNIFRRIYSYISDKEFYRIFTSGKCPFIDIHERREKNFRISTGHEWDIRFYYLMNFMFIKFDILLFRGLKYDIDYCKNVILRESTKMIQFHTILPLITCIKYYNSDGGHSVWIYTENIDIFHIFIEKKYLYDIKRIFHEINTDVEFKFHEKHSGNGWITYERMRNLIRS